MYRLILILAIKTLILGLVIGFNWIGLSPDEAQYWTWSQDLDWGYYSKPPGIAWQIWLTSSLFGNTPFGVRAGALIIGFLLAITVYLVARAAHVSKNGAFWSGVVAAVCPLGLYLSFAATTDGAAILFLTLAAALAVKGVNEEKGPNYVLLGLCIGLGALFKWTAFIFWPVLFIYLFKFKNLRKWSLLVGILISLMALIPTLYWNASHEWATFRHVGKTMGETRAGNFTDFFAAQLGLLTPIFFVLLVMSYFFLRRANRGLIFAAGFPLIVAIYLVCSLFKKMQPNWVLYAYPAGLPLIGWLVCDQLKKAKIWLHIGTWFSILIICLLFAIPLMQSKWAISYKLNPFRQSMGWNQLEPALLDAGYQPEEDFLFADKYQAASLLSFYGPKQKRAYYFNISHTRKNQFSFWPQMEKQEKGRTGYFVVIENTEAATSKWYQEHYTKRLSPYFEGVKFCGVFPLYCVAGKPVKCAFIFTCSNYSGISPPESKSY